MKTAVAKKWVKALRSKRYRQGRGALKVKTKTGDTLHCCLGVLCDLYQKEHKRKMRTQTRTAGSAENVKAGTVIFGFVEKNDIEEGSLPDKVWSWAGLSSDDGYFGHSAAADEETTLMALNDSGASFAKIANLIETHFSRL